MGKYSEVFVAFDVAKKKHAVAIAEGGRAGEVRFLGDVDGCSHTICAPTTQSEPDPRKVTQTPFTGSDSLLVHAPGTARPMTPWHVLPVCCSKGDENISVMVTHAKPRRRQRPTGRTGLDSNGGQPAADLPVRDAVRSPHRVTALTRERFGICPLREHRSSLKHARRAGGVETSDAVGASLPSAFRVLRRRSRARPLAWRVSSGCLAIALAGGPRSG